MAFRRYPSCMPLRHSLLAVHESSHQSLHEAADVALLGRAEQGVHVFFSLVLTQPAYLTLEFK